MEAARPAEPGELPPRTRGEPDPRPRPLRSPDSRLGRACRAREPRALRFPPGLDPGARSPEPGVRSPGPAQSGWRRAVWPLGLHTVAVGRPVRPDTAQGQAAGQAGLLCPAVGSGWGPGNRR